MAVALAWCYVGAASMRVPTRLHDFSAKTIDGVETAFSAYKGKPVLVLNVAAI